ncbi:hypothetical protein KCP70_24495 [Salmonella enterica subsp. enterica]|nr:hypothetical protein KCP70_24495 [Salmonella enterica subsp. enterica]
MSKVIKTVRNSIPLLHRRDAHFFEAKLSICGAPGTRRGQNPTTISVGLLLHSIPPHARHNPSILPNIRYLRELNTSDIRLRAL